MPSKAGQYGVLSLSGVITPRECEILKRAALPGLKASTVIGDSPGERVVDTNIRVSETAWLSESHRDPDAVAVVRRLRTLAALLTGTFDPALLEDVQVVHYSEGGQYKPHFDACTDACTSRHKLYRRATLLVYLNDAEHTDEGKAALEGGETRFPRITTSVLPSIGDGVLFYNTGPDESEIYESFHGGERGMSCLVGPLGGSDTFHRQEEAEVQRSGNQAVEHRRGVLQHEVLIVPE
jgi:prolyl 4-hydroxylase